MNCGSCGRKINYEKEYRETKKLLDLETARAERWKNLFLAHVQELKEDNCIEWNKDSAAKIDKGKHD